MNAGHYWHGVLDFEEKNVHPQCPPCNRLKRGNLQNYALALEANYGPGILQELDRMRREARMNRKPDMEKLRKLYDQLYDQYKEYL
jgi:hypothetical protein